MQRRDFVRGIVAASVAAKSALSQQPIKPATAPAHSASAPAIAPGPVPWMRGLMDVKPLPMTALVPDAFAEASTGFFAERQMATLHHLGEILQPAYKGYPSSSEAGAPEFLDFLIGVSPQEQQEMYRSGLDRLDSEANQKFSKPFAALDESQADQLIRPVLHPWMSDHPPTEPYEKFMSLVQNDIRAATVNSQAWSEAARKAGKEIPNVDLYWYPIDPDLRREGAAAMAQNTSNNLKN
jgi:hypothetical protein